MFPIVQLMTGGESVTIEKIVDAKELVLLNTAI